MFVLWIFVVSAGVAVILTQEGKEPLFRKHKNRIMPLAIFVTVFGLGMLFNSVNTITHAMNARSANHNVHRGWVVVPYSHGTVKKICDTTTLLYSNGASVPNSAECK